MSAVEMHEFFNELQQDVHRQADAHGRFLEDAFFEICCGHLQEAGELDTADRAFYYSPRGIRIDGYGGEPSAADGTLSLIIADFNQSRDLETLTATDMNALFKRARTFVVKALDREFRNAMEETSPGYGLADLIASCWSLISRIKLFLISNRLLSSRVDSLPEGDVEGVPITISVWDISRLQRYIQSGRSREEILVDLEEYGGNLPVLPAHLTGAGYEAYLTVVPGAQLAKIYERWGARLLEQNVRVFLQARGNINKGIKATIEAAPGMFFAYNNGITATAESVTTRSGSHGAVITHLRNLQIVNGGQTTASIASAYRTRVPLETVFVQMKLSVIPPERAEEVVPKISEFANSQNRVNAADFFANHPFHVRFEDFSRRLAAPSKDGSIRETKWFYERARGQFQDARSNLTAAGKKKFELEFPKDQVFTKTDLAKFLAVWDEKPQVVSRGAQKNFAYFALEIGRKWNEKEEWLNEGFYRESVAKAIVFKATEQLVTRQPWYEGGYRANIVAYAIAKLARDVKTRGVSIDFEAIWRAQTVSSQMSLALTRAAEAVNDVLTNPPAGRHKNVTEWAKQDACWNRVAELQVAWPSLESELIDFAEQKSRSKQAVREQRMLSGIEAQSAVVEAGAETWRQVKEWALSRKLLSQKELEILSVGASMPAKLPSEKQCAVIIESLAKLRAEGCPHARDVRTNY